MHWWQLIKKVGAQVFDVSMTMIICVYQSVDERVLHDCVHTSMSTRDTFLSLSLSPYVVCVMAAWY